MALKSVNRSRRQKLWDAIRTRRNFRWPEVMELGDINERKYLLALEKAGIIACVPDGDSRRCDLLNDCGVEAPRLRDDGSVIELEWERVWRSMRMLKEFSIPELNAALEAPKPRSRPLQEYVALLVSAGWLQCLNDRHLPRAKVLRFRLLPTRLARASAPQMATVRVMYDADTGAVLWQQPHVQDPLEMRA